MRALNGSLNKPEKTLIINSEYISLLQFMNKIT